MNKSRALPGGRDRVGSDGASTTSLRQTCKAQQRKERSTRENEPGVKEKVYVLIKSVAYTVSRSSTQSYPENDESGRDEAAHVILGDVAYTAMAATSGEKSAEKGLGNRQCSDNMIDCGQCQRSAT